MPKQPTKKQNTKQASSSKTDKSTKALKKGDKVEWGTLQGKIKGTVKEKVAKPTQIKGHKAKASKGEPQFLVESEKTGKKAAHKASALKKVKA